MDKKMLVKAAGAIESVVNNSEGYLKNAPKQALQAVREIRIADSVATIDYETIRKEKDANGKVTKSLSHRDYVTWAKESGNEVHIKALVAYLMESIAYDLSRRCVLNMAILAEVCESTGLTFETIVKDLQLSADSAPMTQAYYDALAIAANEVAKCQGYQSHRDIFGKTAKTGEVPAKLGGINFVKK